MYKCRSIVEALAKNVKNRQRPLFTVALTVLALVSFLPTASASPIGNLQIATCGGVNVNATSIIWLGAPGGLGQAGYGCINTQAGGVGTSVTYSGGTLGPNVNGEIKSLTFGVTPGIDFMDFTGHPNLIFDLSGFLPGPSNTNCSTLTLFSSCAVTAGSPFVLTLQPGGTGTCPAGISGTCDTSVTLNIATSTVRDLGNSSSTPYSGFFTTQIANLSPAQIQAAILAGGTVGSGASGSFTLTPAPGVPEPVTYFMSGAGLLGLAFLKRRKARG